MLLSLVAVGLLALVQRLEASVSYLGYTPAGSNQLLYAPGVDPVIHLDQVRVQSRSYFNICLDGSSVPIL